MRDPSTLSCVRSRLGAAWGPAAIVAVVLVFLCSPMRLNAQALSGINGTVTDQSGAAIEGASVKITNVDTNVTRTATTTSAGTYYITDLIPGTYDVRVEKSGFQASVQKGVTVVGGATSAASATLVPGAVATEVVINASAIALETEQPEVGTTVGEEL